MINKPNKPLLIDATASIVLDDYEDVFVEQPLDFEMNVKPSRKASRNSKSKHKKSRRDYDDAY